MALKNLKSKLNKLSTTNYFTDKHATGFTENFKPGTTTKYKSRLQLGITDYFIDKKATGFTKNFVPGVLTKFKPITPHKAGVTKQASEWVGGAWTTVDYFSNKFATGFTENFIPGVLTKFKPFRINEFVDIPTVNFFDQNYIVNKGFVPKMELYKTQYKKVSHKQDKFSWPSIIKRIDYKGNNLSPINDFDRQFSTSVGQMASQVVYTPSQLRKKFLFSKDQEAIKFGYKNKYEWKSNDDIRIDSNSTTHPIILKSLLDVDRYGPATDRFGNIGHTIDFVRGGHKTYLDRVNTDVKRLKKFVTSPDGQRFIAKQFLLQLFSPRAESLIFNPLSIVAGGYRVVKMKRFTSVKLITDAFDFVRGIPKDGLGLYEKYEGYGSWNMAGNRGTGDKLFHKGNKLWQYSELMLEVPLEKQTFSLTDIANDPWGFAKAKAGEWATKKYKKAKKKVLSGASKFLSGLAGRKVQLGDIDLPTQYVHSQEHQSRSPVYKSIMKTKNDYKTLPYQNLDASAKYSQPGSKIELLSAKETQDGYDGTQEKLSNKTPVVNVLAGKGKPRDIGSKKIKAMGDQSIPTNLQHTKELGLVKKAAVGLHGDAVNLIPYGGRNIQKLSEKYTDLVKFQFKDVMNNKFIVFRATVNGLTDTITPEWSSERYIGRADQVHVYIGAERSLSFGFTIAPISKQELLILWEKLNYLTGLTYPDYNDNRMVAPWIEFTFGDMYKGVPGFIESLSYSIPDNAPYEIDGIELPKVIEATMEFKYVGNKLQTKQGKHYDLPWLAGTENTVKSGIPYRMKGYDKALTDAGVYTVKPGDGS